MLILRDETLARSVGCREVYLAFEGLNPTGSFKDRGTVVAMSWALAQNSSMVGAVSTGNMAASVSAYARRNGLSAVVVVADSIPDHKLGLSRVFAPTIVRAAIDHGTLYFDALRAGSDAGIYFMSGDDPMRIEGQKTALYDIVAHLHPIRPTHMFLPLSSGGNFLGYAKALRELGSLARDPARLVGVQPSGCAPIWQAFAAGREAIERAHDPQSIALAITNPYPPSGDRVLRACRTDGHRVEAVSDESMAAEQQDLVRRHGLWAQVDSVASIAGLRQAAASGELRPESTVVCVLTGAGYRDTGTIPADRGETIEVDASTIAPALARLTERDRDRRREESVR